MNRSSLIEVAPLQPRNGIPYYPILYSTACVGMLHKLYIYCTDANPKRYQVLVLSYSLHSHYVPRAYQASLPSLNVNCHVNKSLGAKYLIQARTLDILEGAPSVAIEIVVAGVLKPVHRKIAAVNKVNLTVLNSIILFVFVQYFYTVLVQYVPSNRLIPCCMC